LLTPAHETNAIIIKQKTTHSDSRRAFARFRFPEALAPITIAASGIHTADRGKFPFTGISERALFALVEMFITSTAEFPGVTGVDGLKTHWAPPEAQRYMQEKRPV
jgi:hypothetical protein